ncbi:hypothetical protein A8F94_17420 [Bacillus sp. FJAT-27225]|uniref:hypothetical protein n=1 Tax=Bacillus sp. FJAT-27225 TaxID=1743144 RepID=UPI00080C2B1A|nr:hypothetical protein [Bacillus sp. FJAT-27225]OCA84476.1 hypothetical protein A8F94_17420 [Bacillus sp. FJAT-27225]
MYVTIKINYRSTYNNLTQVGSFPLRGKKPEQIAYGWWKQIKSNTYNPHLINVTVDGVDITQDVKGLEKASLPPDNLPF